MGKPMGRHPITHYKNHNNLLLGPQSQQKKWDLQSQIHLGTPSSITVSNSKKWSNLTKVSSKIGRGTTILKVIVPRIDFVM